MTPAQVAELLARIEASMSMVGKMCREHRPPRMSIPVNPKRDEDVFICNTFRACAAEIRRRAGELDAPAVAECIWRDSEGDGNWDTSCGNLYFFVEGGPTENGQRFCGYCGGRLIEHPYVEEIEPDEEPEPPKETR